MTRAQSVPSRPWQLAASACAIAASLSLLFLPLGNERSGYADTAGNVVVSPTAHTTLLENQGPGVLVLLAVPVVLTLVGWLSPVRARRFASVVSTSLLGLGVALAMLSIGVFFVPALVCSIVAIARSQRSSPSRTTPGDTVTA